MDRWSVWIESGGIRILPCQRSKCGGATSLVLGCVPYYASKKLLDGNEGGGAGHSALGMAAHPVGHHDQFQGLVDQEVIFVFLAHRADIGHAKSNAPRQNVQTAGRECMSGS